MTKMPRIVSVAWRKNRNTEIFTEKKANGESKMES